MKDKINLESGEFKPFFKRTSTLIYGVIISLIFLVGILLYKAGVNIGIGLAKENAQATVVECKSITTWTIEKWTAVRKYDRSSLPSNCVWDVDKDTYKVCDSYNQVCETRDSTGCTSYKDGNTCLTWHYETDYDYNLMDWEKFKTFKQEQFNGVLIDDERLKAFRNQEKYTISFKRRYSMKVSSHNKTREFEIDKEKYTEFKENDIILIERRKKSKKILKIK